MMTTQKITSWGNSLGIRLPQVLVQQVGLTEGALISLSIEGDKIILSPTKPKYKLDELLANATPNMQHNEVDWGEPMGEEVW